LLSVWFFRRLLFVPVHVGKAERLPQTRHDCTVLIASGRRTVSAEKPQDPVPLLDEAHSLLLGANYRLGLKCGVYFNAGVTCAPIISLETHPKKSF